MVSFENTEIAFAGKSNAELKRAHLLFRTLGKRWMVKLGKTFSRVAFALHLPIKGIIKKTIFRQFVGGETIAECEHSIRLLAQYRIGTILDYSIEGKQDEEAFDAAEKEILNTIDRAAGDADLPFCVFKVTGLIRHSILEKISEGKPLTDEECREWERGRKRVLQLCRAAHNTDTPVLIDAEESWIQPAIDRLAEEMTEQFNTKKAIVYNTLQMYRHDRYEYLLRYSAEAMSHGLIPAYKIVRGAYMEKERARATEQQYENPIQPDKTSTDNDFDKAVAWCLEHVDKVALCAGTHNEHSSMKMVQLMAEKNIPVGHPHVYFSQLLGMSDHISYNLAEAGYNVAKYVPYGPVKELVPYLIRRAEENTSVAGQTGRELSLIRKELKRRKLLL